MKISPISVMSLKTGLALHRGNLESAIVILFSGKSLLKEFFLVNKKIEKSTRKLHILNNRKLFILEAI